ncbi:cytochrome c [Allopusillimonas soli]|uniref:Cytochrome c n=1 Tax=Allopusillimonas soli TaxID=659016 RepID=A0A853FBS8_9BURK|nr:cytochrome c [Allopusillimonas soli]NYT37092.1 cytochrome c [Allopusillimonas soli]TEA75526.1 cytochrome c [Allopusillimonas soli]
MKTKLALLAATALIGVACMPAHAESKKAKDAHQYRESVMHVMAYHFGSMAPMAKKEIPFDAEVVRKNVAVLDVLATLPWKAFGPDTQAGDAKPEIWSDPEGFKQAQEKFLDGMKKLDAAAASGDFDAFRVAFGTVGKSCKSCHDSYREKDD